MQVILDDLRRYSVARSLFPPTTLKRALQKLGFVQADLIRSPARAQDLMLRKPGTVHPQAVDAHFAHGKVIKLLGRVVECDDSFARRNALPGNAAGGAP
jgi:hypothetical protein